MQKFGIILCIVVAFFVIVCVATLSPISLAKQKADIRVLAWSEGTADKAIYPNDINSALAEHLGKIKGLSVKTANFSDPDHGLTQRALDQTDVLFWWGHRHHNKVDQKVVDRVVKRVKEGGMGLVALHSSHFSRPFKALLNTTGTLTSKDEGTAEHIQVVTPGHPIAKGIKDFTIPNLRVPSCPLAGQS
ncbi:MAG: ThuA domain-containing protein [Acidobacteria bacterium]|nr:ThuA domain-containing protein [Acidobacteriota bacterium]